MTTVGNFISKGVRVTAAGALVNFSLGIFYAWSVFANGLIKEFGWTKTEAMLPYTLELLVFSIAMIFGGRFQDRYGPRRGIIYSGIFTGLSLILCSLVASPLGVTLFFGVIFGSAAAFGYSAVTPAAIKWFPPEKRGSVTGFVLMSLGAAALIWAPVINFLINRLGVLNTFFLAGILVLLIITLSARAIELPPVSEPPDRDEIFTAVIQETGWRETVRNPSFPILWVIIGLTSAVGTMFIAHMVQIAELSFNVPWGYMLVSLFALTNASGRMIGGALCDRIGYKGNINAAFILMGMAMILFFSGIHWSLLVIAAAFLGFSYGSLYASFPNIVATLYGLKNFGRDYGLAFTAVGVIGSLGPLSAAILVEVTSSYRTVFIVGFLAVLAGLYLISRLARKTSVELT
ncbi:MAG: MFS transporter [Bacillota bacterium]|nr:MFS transporter [Bacillota bacterium]